MRDSGYRPQLDALRAFAIMGVLYTNLYDPDLPLGYLGVRLFFVISGFLITGILFRFREPLHSGRISLGEALKTFFVRRGLRMYPAYYALLAVVAILNIQQIRSVLGYHLLFLSNVLFIQRANYVPPFTAPLWTISVEQQLYLVWPFVVLLTPRRFRKMAMVAAIVVGLGYRLISLSVGAGAMPHWLATPAALDALGAGALLAVAGREKSSLRWLGPAAFTGLLLVLPMYLAPGAWTLLHRPSFGDLRETLVLLPMLWLVAAATKGIRGWVGKLLEWSPLVFLGRISYGVYLYHSSVGLALMNYGARIRPSLGGRTGLTLVVGSALSMALATVSWFALEKPVNRLKDRFPYPTPSERRRRSTELVRAASGEG